MFRAMNALTVQLVLHYDGSGFAGWQRQPQQRTVQGVLEESLARLCGAPVPVLGSGRTDAGVHARGQAAGIRIPARWSAAEIRRALNAILPEDVWIAAAYGMAPEFHARYSALRRAYSYHVGLDDEADSPFRRRYEWRARHALDLALLHRATGELAGRHSFRAFAVHGTAPPGDSLECEIHRAEWQVEHPRLVFWVEANRFLHHMVRFLVGTLIDVASGRRAADSIVRLLAAHDNREASPPAPPHALFLERVEYPDALYLSAA